MPFFYKQVLPTLLNDIMARRILSWKSLFLSRWHQLSSYSIFFLRLFGFFNLRFYLFIFRGEGREKYQCVVPSHAPPLGTWPATQAWALTRNQTSDPLVRRLALNPLSHTSQGSPSNILIKSGMSDISVISVRSVKKKLYLKLCLKNNHYYPTLVFMNFI